MEPLTLALAVLLVALLLLFAVPYYWLNWSEAARRVAAIPGPKPYFIIGNALEFGRGTVDVIKNATRLWQQYGSVFRFWLGPKLFILVADPKYVEPILSSTVHLKKNMSYEFAAGWLGDGLLLSAGNKWRKRRKILTPTFHFKILEEFMDFINTNTSTLVKKLEKEVNGPEFNIYDYVTLCALDVICETAMGVSLNAQEDSGSEYVVAVKQMADVIMDRTFSPWLHPSFLFEMSSVRRKERKYLKILHDTTRKVIRTRRNELINKVEHANGKQSDTTNDVGQKRRLAFLDLLLQYSNNGESLSDDDIQEEVDTFMFEGHDTTASGIAFCLMLLAQNPDVQDKVYQEIKGIFGDSGREFTFNDLQELKYLECVIKEAQRIYPSVPFFARELDQELIIDGCSLPVGTNLLVSPFLLHRHPDYFKDPEKFDPDRFLPENAQGRHPYSYVPFSAGPRNCIGQKYAMMELKCTVTKILRHYKLIAGSKPIILSSELILRNWGGIYISLQNRK